MIYFKTRDAARKFAQRTGRAVSDLADAGLKHRWGVQVLPVQ